MHKNEFQVNCYVNLVSKALKQTKTKMNKRSMQSGTFSKFIHNLLSIANIIKIIISTFNCA